MQRIINLFSLLAVLAVNALANALPINGKNTGELSDMYPNLFVPAGVTFSIWGVIYILLIIHVNRSWMNRASTGWLFSLTCLFNIMWIIFWHYQLVLISLADMILLLIVLSLINLEELKWPEKLVFGVYLGWICIATIANATAVLVFAGWEGAGFSQEQWTIILITVGALVSSVVAWRVNNPFVLLSVGWAFYGIVLKRSPDYPAIATTAWIALAGVALIGGILSSLQWKRLRA